MKWRCSWCGKPHESNDPPCDNCGHGSFEKAVVPAAPEAEDDHEWFEWVCTECGRAHQRNSPPCSRCGHTKLERRQVDYSGIDDELTTSYRELLTTRYLAAGALALLVLVVLALGALGVVPIPGVSDGGPPTAGDVPGNESGVNGLAFAAVERAYVDVVNDRRRDVGATPLTRDDTADAVAEYYNKRLVASAYGDGDPPEISSAYAAYDFECSRSREVVVLRAPVASGAVPTDDATALAEALVEGLGNETDSLAPERRRVGLDVHLTPGDVVHVTQVLC